MYSGKIWDEHNQPLEGVLVTLLEPTADNTDITALSGPDGSFVFPRDYDLTGFGLLLEKKNFWHQVYFSIPDILARPLIMPRIRFPWFIFLLVAGFIYTRKN